MITVKNDSRWEYTKWYYINGKPIGEVGRDSYNLFIDAASGKIFSDDTEFTFTASEIKEFTDFLKEKSAGKY